MQRDLFKLQDEGVDVGTIASIALNLQAVCDELNVDRGRYCYHVDSPEWRTWSNPEFLLSDKGLRLDEVPVKARDLILDILRSSLSSEGYTKAISAMRINGFLGELVQSPKVMNEFSYNFVLFGEPSPFRPWGWSLYGHHLCLNALFYKSQIVLSPWFTGAEPNEIDEGPYKGTRILTREEELGLKLMQSLPSELQSKAQLYKLLHDPAMPPGRWNRDDQRHLCGAARDNRIVPYEGILLSDMPESCKELVASILSEYLLYLPTRARELRLEQALSFASSTYFSWIGGFNDSDPFYYRIQSPVVICEFDHHSGVFLGNDEPAKFHVHTLLRTPNGGDYGMALRPLVESREQVFEWSPEDGARVGGHASRTL